MRKIFESEDALNLTHEVLTGHGYSKDQGTAIKHGTYQSTLNHPDAPGVHDSLKGIGWKQTDHVHSLDEPGTDPDFDHPDAESGVESTRYDHPDVPDHSLVVHRSHWSHDPEGEEDDGQHHAVEMIPKKSKMYFG